MEQKVKPSPRIAPLPPEHTPELKDAFEAMKKNLGFVPNSMLILQRKQDCRALASLTASIWIRAAKRGALSSGLVAHVASRTAAAATAWRTPRAAPCTSASRRKSSPAVWSFRTSPLSAKRSAWRSTSPSPRLPCPCITDDLFAAMRRHWTETQIVEILAVIATFGPQPLERHHGHAARRGAMAVGERFLAPHGWSAGKHARAG